MKKRKPLRNDVRYALRFQILPDENATLRAEELTDFCRKHKIPEVHLFCNAEEWNRGHLTEVETEEIIIAFKKIIPIFKKSGLSVNLNLWNTLLHCDRGRTLRNGQNFELMVSPFGKRAKAVVSPACPKWRKYIANLYARMASLGFETIWLEDDFRYHNHAPLDWGGDFGETMLKNFSKKVGRKVTRQELLKNILKPGKPHWWRKAWLELWRETSETNAAAIRDEVKKANHSCRLGLMSSHPDVHSAEGRNWKSLFKSIALGNRAVHRPHFATYSEAVGTSIIYSYILLDRQKNLRPEWVESYPEIENFPFGLFNKSNTLTFCQMAVAKIMGSEGLLLDTVPFSGNSVFEEKGIGQLLDRSYPTLEYFSKEFERKMSSSGVGVPCKEDAALSIQTDSDSSYANLISYCDNPGHTLGRLGITFQMRLSENVNLLWGKNAWSFPDGEIENLLKKGLWLDAEAACILSKRGYGKYLGVEVGEWLEREKSLYAVERVINEGSGVRNNFNFNCNLFSRILKLKPGQDKVEVWTETVDCMNKPIGAGLTLCKNKLGGRVAVSGFPLNAEPEGWNLNFQRQTLVQNLVKVLSDKNQPVMVNGGPHLFPIELRTEKKRKIVVFNLWADSSPANIKIPGATEVTECTLIKPLSPPRKIKFRVVNENCGLTVSPVRQLSQYEMVILDVK